MRYFIGDVAVDEKAVYWNQPGWTNHPGGIVKVAKP
jgi:hypothetical protein